MSGCYDRVRVGNGVWRSRLCVVALCAMAACIQDSAQPGPLGGPSELATAVLTVSPTDPKEQDRVFFNARGSTAAPGRTVVS